MSRLDRLKEFVEKKKVRGFLVTNILNVRYLSGFKGSSGLIIVSGDRNIFVTDFRYKEEAESSLSQSGWEISIEKGGWIKTLKNLVSSLGIRSLGFESSVPYEFFDGLKRCRVRLDPFRHVVENLRAVKDKGEINLIKEAVRRAERAFLEVKPYIRPGIRERQIALMLEDKLKKTGCKRIPFDIIVASGANSSMPHARATDKGLSPGELVVIDWGGEAEGYFSDMTRTLLLRGPDISGKREMYKTVLKANRKAVAAVGPGINGRSIDRAARDVIKDAGYGKLFGHGTGHGIGLEVHEKPHITWTRDEEVIENMVFTIEPGVYAPGIGGVRIEDMVLVRRKGCEVLTGLPRNLDII